MSSNNVVMGTEPSALDKLYDAALDHMRNPPPSMQMPQPSDLRVLALALGGYAMWLERDPNTYDADALAREIEKVGVIDSDEWRPAPWVLEAVKALRG